MTAFITWLEQYGYLALFAGLALELMALPLSGEALMSYAGYLVYQHRLSWAICLLASVLGAITGITLSYWLGRLLGAAFFDKYGHYVHLGPENMARTKLWMERYGNILLIVSYFIPGVRHLTGYFSGLTGMTFRKFKKL